MVGVEQARHHRRCAVEDDLYREELEEERRLVHVSLVGEEALRVDRHAWERHAQKRQHAEEDHDDGEQVGGVLVSAVAAEPFLHRHVDRQERRDEHAAHDQLVEHVGEVVGDLVGARQERGAERERHRPRADEARDARDDGADADERGGRANVGAPLGLGSVAVGLHGDGGGLKLWLGLGGVLEAGSLLACAVLPGMARPFRGGLSRARAIHAAVPSHDGDRGGGVGIPGTVPLFGACGPRGVFDGLRLAGMSCSAELVRHGGRFPRSGVSL